jgi:hypothetical protein
MPPIRLVLLLAAITVAGCKRGKVERVDPADASPPSAYALQNLSRNRAVVADAFTIDVLWLPGPR